MSISYKEMLVHTGIDNINELDAMVQTNMVLLHRAINVIRREYGKPMIVTSCLRTRERHIDIYKRIAKKAGKPFDISKVPFGSRHLTGEAIDIYDNDGKLKEWVKNNINTLEELGIYCEHFDYTPNWVHFQIACPSSGNRFFKP